MSWIIPAAMAGAKVANWFNTRKGIKNLPKTPKATQTAYGKELNRQSAEGIFSPETRQYMMKRFGQNTAQTANQGRGEYSGQMTRMGLENSVAGARGMNEYALKRMQILADKGGEIENQNEMSKISAKEQYGQLEYQDKMASYQDKYNRQTMKMQNTQNLISGLTSILPEVAKQIEPTQFQGMMNEYQSTGDPASLYVNLLKMGIADENTIKQIMAMIAAGS